LYTFHQKVLELPAKQVVPNLRENEQNFEIQHYCELTNKVTIMAVFQNKLFGTNDCKVE